MSKKIPFIYREFYDLPRMIVVRHKGSVILLESAFDAETDDYSDRYSVFVLPEVSEDVLQQSWEGLSSKAKRFLGHIPVQDINFDSTLRKEIDTELIDDLLRDFRDS